MESVTVYAIVKFGEGTVLSIVEGGRDYEVTVNFDMERRRCLRHSQNYRRYKKNAEAREFCKGNFTLTNFTAFKSYLQIILANFIK